MNEIGESRDLAKKEARSEGAKTFTDVAKKTGINSYGTSDTYEKTWVSLANFARDKGVKDIENISGKIVKSFMQDQLRRSNSIKNVRKVSSAVLKMSYALQRYADENKTGKTYNWEGKVSNVRNVAKAQVNHDKLNKAIEGRGFFNPNEVVNNIRNDRQDLVLAAKIQCESGARISEITHIKPDQLRGSGKDPFGGREVGVVKIQGKGGKWREIYLNKGTYAELRKATDNGLFKVAKTTYTNAVREAALVAGQRYTGTHDFRHSWVQNRFNSIIEMGYGTHQALSATSLDIGHVRADITEVYLK
jgi:integrase